MAGSPELLIINISIAESVPFFLLSLSLLSIVELNEFPLFYSRRLDVSWNWIFARNLYSMQIEFDFVLQSPFQSQGNGFHLFLYRNE